MDESVDLPDNLEIRISGGGARSPVWQQIIADVLQQPLTTVNTTEGAAYGAALLATVAAGIYDTVADACAATIRTGDTVTPSQEHSIYDEQYQTYQQLYPALKDLFPDMQTESDEN
jgi:xylulokinase